jgi:hypothetical protein
MITLKELLKMSIEEIISSTHSLTLLKYYSKLYLNGTPPRTCAASQRKYYYKLKKDYQMKKEIIERTCAPKFEGRRYIPGVFKDGKLIAGHLHIDGSLLTDKQALEFLNLGVLTEKDFIQLPDGYEYVKPEIKEETKSEGFTENELLEVLEREDFNELSRVGKALKLFEKRGKKEDMITAIKDHISKL